MARLDTRIVTRRVRIVTRMLIRLVRIIGILGWSSEW